MSQNNTNTNTYNNPTFDDNEMTDDDFIDSLNLTPVQLDALNDIDLNDPSNFFYDGSWEIKEGPPSRSSEG